MQRPTILPTALAIASLIPAAAAQQGAAHARGGDVRADHWAFEQPRAVAVPDVSDDSWVRTPVDAFVLARLERDGRAPSADADRRTLARRLSFDLTGLPPRPEVVQAFVAGGEDERAYQELVTDLLDSPHFAERMAMYWLDLVRYADTTGIHADNPWDVYPYRDYVIGAFASNMPFDRFTREQLAGDLLPDATTDQRVAAAYNRLNLVTREGGSQPKEFLARYMADRVRNVSTVWLAATVGCAECHDHKFDPIQTRDFYRMGAFFADIEQVGVYQNGAPKNRYFKPYLSVPTDAQQQQLAALEQRIERVREALATDSAELASAQRAWEAEVLGDPPVPPTFTPWQAAGPFVGGALPKVHETEFGPERGEAADWVEHAEWADGEAHALRGDRSAFYLRRSIDVAQAQRASLFFGSDDSIRVWLDRELLLDKLVSRGVAPDQERLDVDLAKGRHELLVKVSNGTGGFGFFFRSDYVQLPDAVLAAMRIGVAERSEEQVALLGEHFRSVTPLLADQRAQLRELEQQRRELVDTFPVCLATVATTPQVTRVLRRGDWMDETGEVVEPGVPASFGALPELGRRATRLDLANWLVSGDNPLVARVFVNRLFMLFFGRGIAASLDDFGTQGQAPTHPELLDWLARRFVASGWDVRQMVELLVTSRTYRQSSRCDPETARMDPYNEYFSRQARHRIDAEMVRDNALAVSGLLVDEVYGRSVRPYQPAGFYQHLNFPRRTYQQDEGDALWRRSLYTHWQRQYLHPALAAFDAPSREECTVQRPQSNTPLQALVLLNDPILVEAARVLAVRILREPTGDGVDAAARIAWAFDVVLQRAPTAAERDVLLVRHAALQQRYASDPDGAALLVAIGEHPTPADLDARELAAWTGVARVLLSLHETMTRY